MNQFPLPPGMPADVIQFWEHWQSLPKTGLVPQLRTYLLNPPFRLQPQVALVDVHNDGTLLTRLFGSGLADRSGENFTGRSILEAYHETLHPLVQSLLHDTVHQPGGYLCTRTINRKNGQQASAQGITLPLINKGP